MNNRQQYCLLAAWLIALIATLISLYASEILGMRVCSLCWYQRICIYPLALILGIATYRQDLNIYVYTLPLAFLGAIFALYQYLEQMIPSFGPLVVCSPEVDCRKIDWQLFGFITLPSLSLLACMGIIFFLFLSKKT